MGIAADMAALRHSIDTLSDARNQLNQELKRSSQERSRDVHNSLAKNREDRLSAAQAAAARRQAFVNGLRNSVNATLSAYASELQQAGAAFRGEAAQKKSDPIAVTATFSSPTFDVEEVTTPLQHEDVQHEEELALVFPNGNEVLPMFQSEAVEEATIQIDERVMVSDASHELLGSMRRAPHHPKKRKTKK